MPRTTKKIPVTDLKPGDRFQYVEWGVVVTVRAAAHEGRSVVLVTNVDVVRMPDIDFVLLVLGP